MHNWNQLLRFGIATRNPCVAVGLCAGLFFVTAAGLNICLGEDSVTTQEVSLQQPTTQPPNVEPTHLPMHPSDESSTPHSTSQTSESTDSQYEADATATDFGAGLRRGWEPQVNPPTASSEDTVDFKKADSSIASAPSVSTANSPVPLGCEVVKFRGVLVGNSTRNQLVSIWGEPTAESNSADGQVLTYEIHPFRSVEVLIGPDEIVSAIKITLSSSLDAKQLARQLSLDTFQPATAKDSNGQPLGQVFPERGVIFLFDASESDALVDDRQSQPGVSHVVIHPIEAQSFVLRAEDRPPSEYEQNIRDLQTALELDPQFARAHWLLAQIYLATGQAALAESAAAKACAIEPQNASYQLCHGATQELLGEYDKSVLTVRAVLDRENLPPLDRAQALYQMARLASLGDVEIASKAIPFHSRAIEIADRLATSENPSDRQAAKQLLVEAHLAVAEEIARQAYGNKVETLALWVGRASGLAEDFIASDGGGKQLRLLVAQRALAALASFRPTLDPAPWVAEAEEAAQALLAQSEDPLWRARWKWELGIAYLHALRVDHLRRETASALRYGTQAVECLAAGAATRQAVHSSEQLVGLLYFQIGAVHAVHQLDHARAIQWYEKAEPLLTAPQPVSELYVPRREGEMLVSMGVSFWQRGDKNRALNLTQTGVELIEAAVDGGILAQSTLAVPYGNLASMYRQVGEEKSASKYAELAKTINSRGPSSIPTARGQSSRTPSRTAVKQTKGSSRQAQPVRR